jgi:hypothetical protein
MKFITPLILTALCLPALVRAQSVPPPEKLLPADTLGVFTVPDLTAARRLYQQSPQLRLLGDPAMEAFVNQVRAKLETEFFQPFEQQTGASLADYLAVAQGQVTFALTRNGWPARPGAEPGLVVLIDARDEAGRLATLLTEGRARLVAGGAPMRTERIGTTDFTVLTVQPPPAREPKGEDTDDAGEDAVENDLAEPAQVREFFIGQSGSLLLAGNSRLDMEKILLLKSGGAVLALGDSSAFRPDFTTTLRDATFYGWLNLSPLLNMARQSLSGADGSLPMGLNPTRILSALGLNSLQTASFTGSFRADGAASEIRLRLPETERRGLFRLLAFAPKDSAPPAHVPDGVLAFSRTRIDLLKSWQTLEDMVTEISPQLGGIVKLTVGAIGKDKDPGFDFRRQFVGNLGDDMISWQLPATESAAALASPPQVALISSPKPEELAAALKLLMGMVPPDVAQLQESDVAGQKLWSLSIPMGMPVEGQPPPPMQTIAFSGGKGYLAVATDVAHLEAYLGAPPAAAHALAARAGLRVAADKVGGLGTGMFGYTNDRETMRALWDSLQAPAGDGTNPGALLLQQLLAATAMRGEGGGFSEWFDFKLLPPFAQVEKYFHYSVYAGSFDKEGFSLKYFAPKPPGL